MKNKTLLMTIASLFIAISAVAQVKGTFTDSRDGKVYKTVTIGTQTWMAENLAYKASSGCRSHKKVATFGYLYDWKTAKQVCPTGWHLPSEDEWTKLTDYLGGHFVACDKLREKGEKYWVVDNATNETGFSAISNDYRQSDHKKYHKCEKYTGYWWTSNFDSDDTYFKKRAKYKYICWNGGNFGATDILDGLAVRCIKDEVTENIITSSDISKLDKWEEVSSVNTKSLSIKLEWKIDKNDYRTNPDGSKFYKTELRINYNDGKKDDIYNLPDNVYTLGTLDGGGTPCMIIDPTYETVTVFVLEKNASSKDYGMTGYAYILNKGKEYFVKETIFTRGNFGWFAFFGGSNNGNPTLCHFSFAGYKAMESKRNSNGTWSNYTLGNITPEIASNQLKSHKNILITSKSGVDKMSGISNSTYTINPIYDPPKSNSSTTLSQDEQLGLFVGGLFLVGAAIYKGLESLPSSSGNYTTSSSSSSSSNNCTIEVEEDGTYEGHTLYKATIKSGSNSKDRWFYYNKTGWFEQVIGFDPSIGDTMDEAKEYLVNYYCKLL